MAYGDVLVALYGKDLERAHIDMIGSSISVASKIASIAQPNQVLVRELIYNDLLSNLSENSNRLREIKLGPNKWNYSSHDDSSNIYRVYEY